MAYLIFDKSVFSKIDSILGKHENKDYNLLGILLDTQEIIPNHYIPEEIAKYIAKKLDLPLSRVYSVIKFYAAIHDKPRADHVIQLCNSTTCTVTKYGTVLDILEDELGITVNEMTKDGKFAIEYSSCFGACDISPAFRIDNDVYGHLTDDKIRRIIRSYRGEVKDKTIELISKKFKKINPESLENYIDAGGYKGLKQALDTSPEEVIEIIKKSGLQGRGGAIYPTGKKWEQAASVKGDRKIVICNADEGEPGTFKDKYLLEFNSYRIIEGITIGAYVVGSNEAYIYIREEYKNLQEVMRKVIENATKNNYLGKNILGSDFDLNVKVISGAGAYICGEGSTLIESMEGKIGRPRSKPPYIKQNGYFNLPTLVNNVETFSAVAMIMNMGLDEFLSYGTEKSPGTKLVCLCGNVKHPGTYEIPFGLTLKEIVYDIGGGIENNNQLKFIQLGGASGQIIPADMIDVKYTYEDFAKNDISVGSGSILVADESNKIVDYMKSVIDFFAHESCGKCNPCREGHRELKRIINKFVDGKATDKDFNNMVDIANLLADASFCALGRSAAVPIKKSVEYFKDEITNY